MVLKITIISSEKFGQLARQFCFNILKRIHPSSFDLQSSLRMHYLFRGVKFSRKTCAAAPTLYMRGLSVHHLFSLKVKQNSKKFY